MATDPFHPTGPSKYRDSVDHMRAISFVFDNPNWLMNVFWVGICLLSTSLIPILGQLAVHGYQFAILESLHLRPDQQYPDFDFDKLGEYLMTGVWVFLVTLVLSLITVPLTLGVVMVGFGAVAAGGAAGGEEGAGVAMMVIMPLFVIFIFLFAICINMFMVPFFLRAGLTRDFGKSFDFGFAMQFVRNTWVQMLISGIVFMFAVVILYIIGAAMLCVGILFTMGVGMMMQAHLLLQLYEVHLSRGGDAIPIAPRK